MSIREENSEARSSLSLSLAQFLHQLKLLVLVAFALFKNTGLGAFNKRKLHVGSYEERVLSIFVSLLIVMRHL